MEAKNLNIGDVKLRRWVIANIKKLCVEKVRGAIAGQKKGSLPSLVDVQHSISPIGPDNRTTVSAF